MADEIVKGFRPLFWAARREHVRCELSQQHETAVDYARKHGLAWAEGLLRERLGMPKCIR